MREKAIRAFYKLKGKTSFSQCGEDLIIKYVLRSGGINLPFFVDIGAFDPVKLSNTFLFYLYGSRGLNIEPNPERFQNFLKVRPRDTNLNIGIGVKDETLDYFHFKDPSLNSFSQKEKDLYQASLEKTQIDKYTYLKTEKIQVKNLLSVLLENKVEKIDLLTIDAEGMDFGILESLDYSQFKPKVICVESVEHEPTGLGQRRENILDFLKLNGYYEYAFTGLNSIMVDSSFR